MRLFTSSVALTIALALAAFAADFTTYWPRSRHGRAAQELTAARPQTIRGCDPPPIRTTSQTEVMAVLSSQHTRRRARRGGLHQRSRRVGAQLGGTPDSGGHAGGCPRHLGCGVRAASAADPGGAGRCGRGDRRAPASATAGASRARSGHDPLDGRPGARSSAAPCRSRSRLRTRRSTMSTSPSTAARVGTALEAPYLFELDTSKLADGTHQLAVNVGFQGGGYAIAVWKVTVENAPGSPPAAPGAPVSLPVAKSWLPAAPAAPAQPTAKHGLYRAVSPARPVSLKQLDAALVGYLGLGAAAREIQGTLQRAGLRPPANTGNGGGRAHARAAPQPSGGPGRSRAAARPGRDPRRKPRSRSRSSST